MRPEVISKMQEIVGKDYVISGEENIQPYVFDEVEPVQRPEPNYDSIVVKPANTEEIAEIMKYANENKVIVVVRGGGTGLCGACTPIYESIILSVERLNKILEIDRKNMVAVLETGVTLADLLEELKKHEGLGFPVHPGDEGCQMGGMAVMNAGGSRAVRHGVTRKQIMGLEIVTPTGDVMELGGKMIKNNAGYNLKELIVGSEGTLAIVTKVILKIYPVDKYTATILAPFERFEDASDTVTELLATGNIPLAVEYQDKWLFVNTAKMLGKVWQAEKGNADLIIILSERTEDALYNVVREVNRICKEHGSYDLLYAGRQEEQDELMYIRNQHWELIKDMEAHGFDMAVPVGEVPAFLKELKDLVAEYNTVTNVTAHIADGNIHSDIVLVDGKMPEYAEELKMKMFDACFRHHGTITGEHGIGKMRVDELKLQKSKAELDLMRGIKKVFDPNLILNPGTVIDFK